MSLENEYITYNKSFIARCSLASNKIKNYYKEIKEELLSYKGVRSRISWQYDSFSYKRNKVAILTIRGNTLSLYLALDINNYVEPKYKLKDEGHKPSYEDTPLMLKIRGSRTLKYAKELIKDLFSEEVIYKPYKINNNKFKENYRYDDLQELIELDLVKEIRHKITKNLIKVKIYTVVLPETKNLNFYLTGNISELGNWDLNKAIKLKKVYDNYYQITLRIKPCSFAFKIVASQDFKYVEKGIWAEEIKNHYYDIKGNMIIEDIIHHLHYEGDLK